MRWKALAVPAFALGVLVLVGGAAAGGTQLYAKGVHVCSAKVQPGHATCFAMKRVLVQPGTPGAQRFSLPAATGSDTIGPNGGLTPDDIAGAYQLARSGGAGQTIAIVDAYNDPNIQADLDTFDANYGLTCNSCLTVHNMGTAPGDNDATGWSVEESLDVEAAHSACPKCHILLIEAVSASDTDLADAENYAAANGADEISNSFGGAESGSTTDFQKAFDQPGIVVTASSGDDGYYSYDLLGGVNEANVPASYPTVVAVGGTSLYLAQSSTPKRSYETVWNTNGPQLAYAIALGGPLGADGGGCSALFSAQNWQKHMPGYTAAACGGKRLVSDVSMDADPLTGFDIYDSYTCASGCVNSPTWATIGGTSLSAPLVAASYALAGGAHGLAYPSVTLYSHPASSRYDVTVGGNGFCDGEGAPQCGDPNLLGLGVLDCDFDALGNLATGTGACDAAPGFDGPTGVGTPASSTLFSAPKLTVSAIAGPTTAKHGVASGPWSVTASDPAPGGTVTCTWNWGDGSAISTGCGKKLSHKYAKSGTKTITVTTHDNYGIVGSNATKKVKVT